MGIYGRLPATNLVPRGKPTSFVYFENMNKIRYINFHPDDCFTWEVYEDIRMDGDAWMFGPNGRRRGVWQGYGDEFIIFDHSESGNEQFHFFVGRPEIIRQTPHS